MFKKSIAALFVGTAVLMTACGGNAATTAPAAEALRLLRQRRQFPRKLPGPRSVLPPRSRQS